MPLITLLTDFGTADGYVGEMKGVIYAMLPQAQIVDIAHDVAPRDVDGARLAIARYWRRFPLGTIHLVVVDPGVGTSRAALAVESDGRFLVGPDNGVLSPALLRSDVRVVELPTPPQASATFHGRDVFAPAAARLAGGSPLEALGRTYDAPVLRRTPEAKRLADGTVSGEVITVDRFGNLITNLVAPRGGSVVLGERVVPIVRSYGDGTSGDVVAVIGSSGLLEIAVRDGSAGGTLGAARGTPVLLRPAPPNA
ncbi:MAG TPA: SAM-dependent chlorinase/fluorinase [Gemmatimonadaceae bacterium]|nr:SAM-dependent chlorinase/fluorinase [Gemmatimonadaceae bacterium]